MDYVVPYLFNGIAVCYFGRKKDGSKINAFEFLLETDFLACSREFMENYFINKYSKSDMIGLRTGLKLPSL